MGPGAGHRGTIDAVVDATRCLNATIHHADGNWTPVTNVPTPWRRRVVHGRFTFDEDDHRATFVGDDGRRLDYRGPDEFVTLECSI